jgi:GTP-binding nuclear protein Ran
MAEDKREFKILLVGDGGIGKTTYIHRHQGGEFERKYLPTVGVNIEDLIWHTSSGDITLHIWDTAGQEKFGYLREGYYMGADAAIIMFDVTSRLTYKNVPRWYTDIRKVCPDIPIVLCGNKADSSPREVPAKQINEFIHNTLALPYYDISVKSNYNYEKPFIHLLRLLCNDENLILVSEPFEDTSDCVEKITNLTLMI